MQSSFKGLQTARGARYPSLNLNYNVFTNYSDAARTITGFDTTGNILPVGYVMLTNELVVAPELRYNFQSIPFSEQLNSNLGQNIGIGLSIPIFNGWSANSNVKRSRLQWTIAKYNYDQSRLNLKRDISTAVTDAQNASKRYNAQKKLTESLQTTLDYTTKRYEAGLLNVYDFNTARKNLFDAQSQTLQAKYDYLFKLKILDFYQGKKITLP
jgi:outer membrane protein